MRRAHQLPHEARRAPDRLRGRIRLGEAEQDLDQGERYTGPPIGQPGATQACKLIVPANQIKPELNAHEGHEGHEWLYVLVGRMRLILGDHDLVLGAGEVVEFDTRVAVGWGNESSPADR